MSLAPEDIAHQKAMKTLYIHSDLVLLMQLQYCAKESVPALKDVKELESPEMYALIPELLYNFNVERGYELYDQIGWYCISHSAPNQSEIHVLQRPDIFWPHLPEITITRNIALAIVLNWHSSYHPKHFME